MKETKYLHNFPRFHPFLDFYKKLHNNPKIYKLAKLLSKSFINHLNKDAKPKSLSIPKPRPKKSKVSQKEESPRQNFHLPKLPTFEENKIVHSVEIYNLKLASLQKNNNSKIQEKSSFLADRRKSVSISKGSMQNFNFSPLLEARNTSISVMPQTSDIELKIPKETIQKTSEKLQEKILEKQKRNIVYSKQKYNVNVQDFSSFFDYREGQFPLHSSCSN